MPEITLVKKDNGWFHGRKQWNKGTDCEWLFGDGIRIDFKFEHNGRFKFSITESAKGKYYFTPCGDTFHYLSKKTPKQNRCLGVMSSSLIDALVGKLEFGKLYDIQIEQIYINEAEREATEPRKNRFLGKKYYHRGRVNSSPMLYTVTSETYKYIGLTAEGEWYAPKLAKKEFIHKLKLQGYSSNVVDILLIELNFRQRNLASLKEGVIDSTKVVAKLKKLLEEAS